MSYRQKLKLKDFLFYFMSLGGYIMLFLLFLFVIENEGHLFINLNDTYINLLTTFLILFFMIIYISYKIRGV